MILMLCEKCGKNNATVMYTQIVNGQKSTLNICSQCASRESIFDNFGSLLNFGTRQSSQNTVCPVCKMTLAEFSRKGRMGCGECYKTFRSHAGAMLKKIHGTQKHVTTSPEAVKEAPKEAVNPIDDLRKKLTEAINSENFEEAALLRDKIREMENETKNLEKGAE